MHYGELEDEKSAAEDDAAESSSVRDETSEEQRDGKIIAAAHVGA